MRNLTIKWDHIIELTDDQILQHFRCQRDDTHVVAVAQFAGNGAKNTGAARFVGSVEQYHRIIVEADVGAVFAADLFARPDDNSLRDGAFFDGAAGGGVFHRYDDLVADAGITLAGMAQHADAEHFFRAGVVGHIQTGLLLNHDLLFLTVHGTRFTVHGRGTTAYRAPLAGAGLFCSFDDFDQAPALEFTQGTSFHDFHNITDAAIIVLIVGHETLGLLHEFTVNRVA